MKAKAAALTSVLTVATLGMASASAAEINFTGEVLDVTCNVVGGAGTNGGATGDFTVALEAVSKADLSIAGATAGDHGFSIQIGGAPGTPDSCEAMNGKTAKMQWSTTQASIDAANNVLRNTGTAQNVGIELVNGLAGTPINLSNPNDSANPGATVSAGTATLNYVARYKAIGAAAVEGDVQSTLEYVVTYN
ncbi:fimbrial protein [Lysobacter sp. LF1]|uniref:Fimbrial protein n=1 Tax=Lysobacter stagni TaxID=3045172 RepID=A0ABT6XJE7_9GAMM|nr:fimbrial protein [Lysobacter sp. LF1]MDI9239885.1 fimbrial protein [Lysobacter sp. LF1]